MPDQYTVLLDAPGGATARIPLARLGDYHDKRYGDFKITASDVTDWQTNLKELPGGRALIDEDHLANKPSPHRDTRAAGWITGIELGDDGKQVYGEVEWTPRGKSAVENGEYLFTSPTFGPYTNDTGKTFANTLTGAALTNKPFLTSMPQITLASDEAIQRSLELDPAAAFYQKALDGDLGAEVQTLLLASAEDDAVTGAVSAAARAVHAALAAQVKDPDKGDPNDRAVLSALRRAASALDDAEMHQARDSAGEKPVSMLDQEDGDVKNLETSDSPRQMFTPDEIKTLASIAGITDEAEVAKIVTLGAEDGVENAKVLEAIADAKPAPAQPKTLEELAQEAGVKTLSADEHAELTAKAGDAADLQRQLDEAGGTAPTKTLEELAAEAGHSLIDPAKLVELEQAASSVPALEVAVKRLSDDAEESRKELQDSRFEAAYDAAEREGRAVPANKDRMKAFFQLDAENTLTMLAEAPPIVGVRPKGANVQPHGDSVPDGAHAEHFELEQQIAAYQGENPGADYATALHAVSGVKIPGLIGVN